MKIDESIFGMYDIRGVYGKNLTEEVAEIIGKAVGTIYLDSGHKTAYIGRDNRISGPQLQSSFIKGILSTGCDVVNMGVIMTPMSYYAWYGRNSNASGSVTASHNPAEYNGFKLTIDKRSMIGEDYQNIYELAISGKFSQGIGKLTKDNLWLDYKKSITENVKIARPLKIVIDTANGTCSLFEPELFRELGCEVIELFTDSDGTFPNHEPYPQKEALYSDLKMKLNKSNADLGLAFDGDGDRLGVYDKTGQFIQNDILAMLFARDILKNHPGATIVMNISTSMAVLDDINNHGGKTTISETGYPWVTKRMKENNAVFGGEISGHFFFKDRFFGFDDASYAAARIVELVSKSDVPLSQMLTDIPEYVSTSEFRVLVPLGKEKFSVIKSIITDLKSQFKQAEILDIDGIRFTFKDKAWGLIRASNTEPRLTGRAEAKSIERLEELKKLIQRQLKKHGGIGLDWTNPIEVS